MQDKIKISVFKNLYDSEPKTVSLSTLVEKVKTSKQLKALCTELQSISIKSKQQEFKRKNFPSITVSGVFTQGHHQSKIKEHSGLIQIDIDNVVSLGLESITVLTQRLQKDEYTFVLFRSPSATGIKLFVKIDGSKHLASFISLEQYYKVNYNIIIDSKCKDVGRLCFLSYDPGIYVNEASKLFQPGTVIDKSVSKPILTSLTNDLTKNVETVLQQIEELKVDITKDYETWLNISFAFADSFGESGRNYFHRTSKFYPKYNYHETDKQYTNSLKANKSGITIKSFFHLAKENGLNNRSLYKTSTDSKKKELTANLKIYHKLP